jgi:hypothetical protein
MVAPLEPIRAVKCNIDGCYQSFDSEKEMKRHKLDDPTHFYCKKCDVDCKDWVDLIEHKVDLGLSAEPTIDLQETHHT